MGMKTLAILLVMLLASCSQVIGGPDRSSGHGGHVIITTKGHPGEKPGYEQRKGHAKKDA